MADDSGGLYASPSDKAHGRNAVNPWRMPLLGWKDVLLRTWHETGEDNIGLIAAGVAFYGFLALVPMLGAIVLSYGLVASPASVVKEMHSLTAVMPADAAKLIGDQLLNVVKSSDGKKGFGLILALAISLYGAMKGASSIVTALNIAYEQEEKRGFVALNLLALAITASAVVLAIVAVVAIGALGHLDTLFPGAPTVVLIFGKLLSYVFMAAGGAAAAASLYRYGPDRHDARWIWLTPGSLAATLLWLMITLGFGVYVANFGSYNATYGSLAAVVVMLTWLYLSAYALLLGAELNAELERQTVRDTTEGPEKPLGQRRATVADMVAGEDAAPPLIAPPPPPAGAVRRVSERPAPSRPSRLAKIIYLSAFVAAGRMIWSRRSRAQPDREAG